MISVLMRIIYELHVHNYGYEWIHFPKKNFPHFKIFWLCGHKNFHYLNFQYCNTGDTGRETYYEYVWLFSVKHFFSKLSAVSGQSCFWALIISIISHKKLHHSINKIVNISRVPTVHHGFPSYFSTTNCLSSSLECTVHSWLTVWVKVHQLKNLWGQAVCSPHHLDSARGGQGRPPRRECFSTFRLLVDSPIPQDRLHGDQGPHSPTWHDTARRVPFLVRRCFLDLERWVWSSTIDGSTSLLTSSWSSTLSKSSMVWTRLSIGICPVSSLKW